VTFSNTKTLTIACVAMMAFAAAQTPPPADNRKWKNDQEQTLGIAAANEKDPAAQIEKLDKWKHDFPESDYDEARTNAYLIAYGQLKRYHEQIMADQELRKKHPDNLDLLRMIFVDVPQIKPPSPDDLAAVTDAARFIIDHPDDVFSAKNKPANQTDDQWSQLKPQMVAFAQNQLDWVAEQQGKEAVLGRLKQDPTRVQLNVWLGKTILEDAKKGHPEMQADAIFHYARAAAYTGPGCLPDKDRGGMRTFVDRAYKTYHGTLEGEDKLLAFAAGSALPGDYHIKSNVEMANEDAAKAAKEREGNPMLAQWRDVKAILTADGGQAKFDADIKDSALPKFSGKIISMTPALRPKTIVLAVEKDGVADCTLTFEAALPGKMEAGETLTFEGIAKSFTKDPYMLTMGVEKDKLEGWTGKNAPPARPPAAKKKTTP
jgi:tetratricopeptide (TPR) repeat protein